MNYKRILSILVLFPITAAILIFGNEYLVDVCISIIAIMSLYEYFNSFKKGKETQSIRIIAYIMAALISLIHVIPSEYISEIVVIIIPISILILFSQIIATDMKYNIKDISISFFSIGYIVIFIMFIPLIRGMTNGKILIWYPFLVAWGTDTFSFLIGRKWGKHKFTTISPNKTIEGCLGGIIGSIIFIMLYTFICNRCFEININYIYIIIVGIILSLVGQLGDLAASSIKRYTQIKDFSNLIPGHGGILDRIDSVIFIAPFAYFLLMLL